MSPSSALLQTALASLSQSQRECQLHRAIADRLPVAYLQLDRQGHIEFASGRARCYLERDRPFAIGDSLLPRLSARDRPILQRLLQQVLDTDGTAQFAHTLDRPAPVPDPSFTAHLSALPGCDCVLLIWERTNASPHCCQAETVRALEQQKARYELALSSGEVGIWDWDIDSGDIYLSPNLKALLGYRDDEIPNRIDDWSRHIHPDDLAAVRDASDRVLSGDRDRYELEHRMCHRDGSVRWFLARGAIVRDASDRPLRLVGSDTDITAFKNTAAALAASRNRLRQIVNNIPGMAFDYLLRPDGTEAIAYASPGCQDIFEISPEQAQDNADFLREMMHPDDRPAAEASIARSAATLEPWNLEWRVTVPSGQTKWLQGISRPQRCDDGSLIWNGLIFDITDRKRTEEDLQDLAQRLLTVIETVDDGITLSDDAGNFGLFNARMAEITGYTSVEAQQSEDFLQLLYPDPAAIDTARERLRQVRESGCLRNVETTIRHKDGSSRTLLVSTTYLPLSERHCYLSAYRDITDRKLAYDRLHRSQQFIEAVANTSPQILYTLHLPELTTPYVNHQIAAVLGYVPENFSGTTVSQWQSLWHPDDRALLNEYFARLPDLADGEVSEVEYRLRHADGSYRWLRSRNVVFERDERGNIRQILGNATDITARKRVEMQLAERESQLNAIVNSTSDGIAIVDEGGIVRFVNAAAVRLLGRPRADLLDAPFEPSLTATKCRERLELPLRRPDGTRVYLECAVDRVPWQGNDATLVSLRDITRRRATEAALRESEARFRQLADNIESAFWLLDSNAQTVLYRSPAYERIYGDPLRHSLRPPSPSSPSAEEPDRHRTRLDFVHPQDRDRVAAFIQQQLAGDRVTCDYRIVRADGVRWIRDRAFPVYDTDGNLSRIAGIAEDITERHFAEAALRASETALRASQNRLNGILASLDDVVWSMCAHTGQLLYVSPAVERVYGLPTQRLTARGNPWLNALHPSDRPKVLHHWQHLSELGSFDIEYRLLRPANSSSDGNAGDGDTGCQPEPTQRCDPPPSHRWVRTRARWVGDERGAPLRIDGITSDITQLKRAEIALRQSEERFRSLVANVPGVIYRCLPDRDWTTLFISEAIEHITGYSAGMFLNDGRFWAKLIYPDDLPRVSQTVNIQIARHQPYAFEYRVVCADGSIRWVYERGQGLWDEWGNLLYLDGAMVDISDRKRTEQILQRQSERDRLLNTLTERIRQSLQLQDILDNTVREVRQCLNADRVLLFHLTPDGSGRIVSESVLDRYPSCAGLVFPEEEFPRECFQNYRQGRARIVPDVMADELGHCLQEYMAEMQVKSKVVVPVLDVTSGRSHLWGLLIAHQCSDFRPWQEWEMELLQRLAANVGIAIGQANLYAQVREREQRLRTMFAQAAVGIAIADHCGRIRGANPRLLEILGRTEAEVRSLSCRDLTHPADRAQEEAYMARVYRGDIQEYSLEKRYLRPDGEAVWAQLTLSTFPTSSRMAGDFLAIVQDISDRKSAEFRLQQQLNLETALAQVSQQLAVAEDIDWQWIFGVLGRAIAGDRLYIACFRKTRASWLGEWCAEGVPSLMSQVREVDVRPFRWSIQQLRRDRAVNVPSVAELPDAARAERDWLQARGVRAGLEVPVRDRRGKLWGCIGVNVTRAETRHWSDEEIRLLRLVGEILYNAWERRRVERELRKSEKRFRATFEQAAVGMAQHDLQGRFLRVNSEYCQLMNCQPDDLLGRRLVEVLHPSDRAATADTLTRMLDGTLDTCSREKRLLGTGGRRRWVQMTAALVRDEDGTPQYIICAVADIHERKQYQTALERLRHRYELILNAAGEGICEIDLSGHIAFCNPTAARMLGAQREIDAIGIPVVELLAPATDGRETPGSGFPCELNPANSIQLSNASASDSATDDRRSPDSDADNGDPAIAASSIHQATFRRLDGSTFPVDYICTPIVYDGRQVGAVLTFNDISDRLAVERLKNEFVSIVSHELRTPLTPMRVALGLLDTGKLGELSEKGKHLVSIALTNTDRLRRLIDDLLDFQRLESGRVELNCTHCRPEELLQLSVETMRAMAERDRIHLEITPLTPELKARSLWIDSDRLLQVLTNLIGNALKFSAPDSTITLAVREDDTPGAIGLTVRDRGRGIPPDRLERVFEPFQQVDASDSRQKGGTGLGLAICRRIIEQHGGQIWAETPSDGGTQIYIRLPAGQATVAAEAPPAQSSSASGNSETEG